jgi:hypothetical protein
LEGPELKLRGADEIRLNDRAGLGVVVGRVASRIRWRRSDIDDGISVSPLDLLLFAT